jgi:two-component system cell cycle response regulator
MKILIAEDDALSRVLLERTLQRAGYEVVAVENGEQAIQELAKEDAPQLALLDWLMPERSGLDVCREIRKKRDQAYTYVVLISSKESKRDIIQGLEAGADDYLTKPFDADELRARLRTGERILDLESRLMEAHESMRFQATHDLLTSLWNRGVIVELLSGEVSRSHREHSCTAVFMCDVDHFKSVNDEYGHASGDDVLREISRRLHQSVRSYDMVGRYGGEEFLVVVNRCNPSSAVTRAEILRSAVCAKPIDTLVKPLNVSISVGVALTVDFPHCRPDELIHAADAALYQAKRSGRNCVRLAQPSKPQESGVPHIEKPTEAPIASGQ